MQVVTIVALEKKLNVPLYELLGMTEVTGLGAHSSPLWKEQTRLYRLHHSLLRAPHRGCGGWIHHHAARRGWRGDGLRANCDDGLFQ
jgi:hypothetical protein